MMKTTFLVASALLLAGCVSVKPTHLDDGSVGHAITCNGSNQTMGACYEKAAEICGTAGFQVVDKFDSSAINGAMTGSSGVLTTKIRRNMYIKCNS